MKHWALLNPLIITIQDQLSLGSFLLHFPFHESILYTSAHYIHISQFSKRISRFLFFFKEIWTRPRRTGSSWNEY